MKYKNYILSLGLFFLEFIISPFIYKPVIAQIIPDNTLPVNSQSTPGCTICQINGGTIKNTNLFHSFQEFSIPTDGQALFKNNATIQNIFTRVTGNSLSNIDGLIHTNYGANLFFINPNGIVFGKNARLDIGGSFIASTANSIKFADNTEFNTQSTQNTPLLTITTPIGLQLGKNSSSIQVQATNGLEVQPNQTLALVGGNINLQGGTLRINGGRLELGSVTGESLVQINPTSQGFFFGYDGVQKFGDIQIIGGLIIDNSSVRSGEIQIQTGNLRMSEDSQLMSLNLGSLPGGNISINATDSIEVIGKGRFEQIFTDLVNPTTDLSKIRNSFLSLNGGTENGNNFEINTSKLIFRDGAFLIVSAIDKGRGGNININASESVEIINSLVTTGNRVGSSGDAGNITVNTKNLIVQDRGLLTSSAVGSGKAGNLTINTESIQLNGGKTFFDPLLRVSINTNINTVTFSSADAGNLNINAKSLVLENGASISAGSTSSGKGGNLTINAPEIELNGSDGGESASGFFVASSGTGGGGKLTVNTDKLQIKNGATITVDALGTGRTGNLNVNARSIYLDNFATITANTKNSNFDMNQDQASISLGARDLIMRRGSSITTNATGDNAIGGNITINTDVLLALENSDISANSTNFRGGRVVINSQGIFGTKFRSQLTPESDITASSNLGAEFNGIVQLNTPDIDPTAGLLELPINLVDTEILLANNICANDKITGNSSFVITGKGGLPANSEDLITNSPGIVEWANNPYIQNNTPVITHQKPKINNHQRNTNYKVIQQAQGWVIAPDGRIMLTVAAPKVTPQNIGLNHPNCH